MKLKRWEFDRRLDRLLSSFFSRLSPSLSGPASIAPSTSQVAATERERALVIGSNEKPRKGGECANGEFRFSSSSSTFDLFDLNSLFSLSCPSFLHKKPF